MASPSSSCLIAHFSDSGIDGLEGALLVSDDLCVPICSVSHLKCGTFRLHAELSSSPGAPAGHAYSSVFITLWLLKSFKYLWSLEKKDLSGWGDSPLREVLALQVSTLLRSPGAHGKAGWGPSL